MKKRKWILPVCIVGGIVIMCFVALLITASVVRAKGYGISVGCLYFADTETYLIDSGDKTMIVSNQSKDDRMSPQTEPVTVHETGAYSNIDEKEAIAIAEKEVTVEYNQTCASFDTKIGCWRITFSKKNTAGGNQDITVSSEGEIIDIEYGE